MKQEYKELLLKDLCSRLPYGVRYIRSSQNYEIETLDYIDKDGCIDHTKIYTVEHIKPYLFPLSSMTEEQQLFYSTDLNYMPYYQRVDWFNKHHLDYRGLIPIGLAEDATGLNIY